MAVEWDVAAVDAVDAVTLVTGVRWPAGWYRDSAGERSLIAVANSGPRAGGCAERPLAGGDARRHGRVSATVPPEPNISTGTQHRCARTNTPGMRGQIVT